MALSSIFYFNYFSISGLIVFIFMVVLITYLAMIPKKSKATFHLIFTFVGLAFISFAYAISSSIYHPLASYHRWLTTIGALLAYINMSMFIWHYPDNLELFNKKIKATMLVIFYSTALIILFLFFKETLSFNKLIFYRFDAHYWDIISPSLQKINSVYSSILLIYNCFIINIIAILKFIQMKKQKIRGKSVILIISVCCMLSMMIPIIFLTKSNEGAISKEIYILSWEFFIITGFFLITILYMNNTSDKISFIGKLIGLSLVTFFVILQYISFFSFSDKETAYDQIYSRETKLIIKDNKKINNIKYIIKWNDDGYSYDINNTTIDFNSTKNESLNTILLMKISSLAQEQFQNNLIKLLNTSHEEFRGYKTAILEFAHSLKEDELQPSLKILNYIEKLDKSLVKYRLNIPVISENDIRSALHKMIQKDTSTEFQPFKKIIQTCIDDSKMNNKEVKHAVLQYICSINPEEKRLYRINKDNTEHYIAYAHYINNTLYEVGFPYIQYRKYMHSTSVNFIILMIIFVIILRFFFIMTFSGVLVKPLLTLQSAVKEVNKGNLDVSVPVKINDEIGYISHTFNKMVISIKESQKQLHDYAANLEQKVQERTIELQKAKDALWGEMMLAKRIQTALLPKETNISGFSVSTFMQPADEVGGDYYDIININNMDWIVIGDVSGHGVPAGLIMMMVQTSIHTALINQSNADPAVLLSTVNEIITQNIQLLGETKYMTITVLSVFREGKFYFSGLHLDMLLFKAKTKEIKIIETRGMWIGIDSKINDFLHIDEFMLDKGDCLLLFTDGLVEIFDESDTMVDENFLIKKYKEICLNENNVEKIKEKIIDTFLPYKKMDDYTIVIIKKE